MEARRRPPGTTGLYHVAIRYPDRTPLGDALRRLVEARWSRSTARPTTASARRSTSATPTGTGSSSTATGRARSGRARSDGEGVAMFNAPLDLQALLAEAAG